MDGKCEADVGRGFWERISVGKETHSSPPLDKLLLQSYTTRSPCYTVASDCSSSGSQGLQPDSWRLKEKRSEVWWFCVALRRAVIAVAAFPC